MTGVHRKQVAGAPPLAYAIEAAGLSWLAQAGGAAVVGVLDLAADHLDLERVPSAAPTPDSAEAFGRALALTHAAGAPAFGCAPPGVSAPEGWIGRARLPFGRWESWAPMYAQDRVAPYARLAADRGALSRAELRAVEHVITRLPDGDLGGPPEPPARLHGDLWSGNVLWSTGGAVLIDPAAHGGHRETDLAMLALFGAPYLERVLAAYDEAAPLGGGWQDRVGLHQLHPLLVHAALFGGGYGAQAAAVARRCR